MSYEGKKEVSCNGITDNLMNTEEHETKNKQPM